MKNIFTIIAIIALLGIGYMIISNNTQSTNIMNDENILLFTITPEKEECVGVGPMQCLIVNGEYFYDSIDGFDFEEGYHYTIKVQRDERVNPPADASMYTYTLVEVVEKKPATENPTFRYSPEGTSWMYNGGTLSFKDGRYTADFGCNTINGSFTSERFDLTFGAPMSTRKACPPEVAQKEQQFSEYITQMTTFSETESGAILSGNGIELILEK